MVAVGAASGAGPRVTLAVRAKPAGSDRIVVTGRVTPTPRVARIEVQANGSRGWRHFVGGPLNHGAFTASGGEQTNAYAAQLGSEIDAASRAPVNPSKGAGGTLGSGGIGGPPATPVPHC